MILQISTSQLARVMGVSYCAQLLVGILAHLLMREVPSEHVIFGEGLIFLTYKMETRISKRNHKTYGKYFSILTRTYLVFNKIINFCLLHHGHLN
jgi:hypothetical protein